MGLWYAGCLPGNIEINAQCTLGHVPDLTYNFDDFKYKQK